MKFKDELAEYKEYLQSLNFALETIKRSSKMLAYYLEWKLKTHVENLEYTDLLNYIRHLQEEEKSNSRINKYLLNVRHYLDLKVKQKYIKINPATGLQLRARQHKIIKGIITKEEQETLWKSYQGKHKLMLSFVLNQALTIKEMERIEKQYIDLENGAIYIASGRKHNSRKLKLKANQIVLILQYIRKEQEKLFGEKPQNNNAYQLGKQLEKINPKIRNLRQLRASVIAQMLKEENMRVVQYKIGHKHITSVEKYKQQDLETLKNQLNSYHPLQ